MFPTPNSKETHIMNTHPCAHESDEVIPARRQRDVGVTTVELLSWSAMLVVAIVLIAGLLQTLGVDVINYVRLQIGL